MKNSETILDLKKRTKDWNKEFLGNEDDTIVVTTNRNEFSLILRKKDDKTRDKMITIDNLDNTTTIGDFVTKI
jgi:hypothetical protein